MQVGKTYVIEKFGKENFETLVTVNFEEKRDLKKIFERDLDPLLIIRDLSVRLKKPIIPGKTVLFFDEIQACSDALYKSSLF